jgi:hypothetical protein
VSPAADCNREIAFSTYFVGAPKQSDESMNFTCPEEDGENRSVEITRPIEVSKNFAVSRSVRILRNYNHNPPFQHSEEPERVAMLYKRIGSK